MLMRLLDVLHTILRTLLVVAFTSLILTVALQVVARTMLPQAPVWTEEYSRIALIFSAALGVGWALRTGDLVNVDIVTMLLGRKLRLALEIVVMVGIIVFCIALVPPALEFVDIGSLQTSPALEWNMFWVHTAMVLAPLTLMLTAFERIILILTGRRG